MLTSQLHYLPWVTRVCLWTWIVTLPLSSHAEPIEIAAVEHTGAVDFQSEILPVLRKKCLACHNATDAESDLVLENPAAMLKGGAEGPAVVAGNSSQSLLLSVAAHVTEPVMPPEDNDVGAEPLTPTELGLVKLWIDEGAKGKITPVTDVINWQPLPAGVNPVYSVAMSADGQFVVAGRANQVFVYRGRQELGRLTDDELTQSQTSTQPGVAHLDIVQSLAFSPNGQQIASGGYRTVKLWQRLSPLIAEQHLGTDETVVTDMSADGTWTVVADAGNVAVWRDSEKTTEWLAHADSVSAVALSDDQIRLATIGADKLLKIWRIEDQAELAQIEFGGQVNDLAWSQGRIIAAGDDHHVYVWTCDGETNQLAVAGQLEGHSQPVTALVAVGDHGLLSAGKDGTVRQWDLQSLEQKQQLNHGGPVTSLAVSADGKKCVTGSETAGTKLWDLTNGSEITTLKTSIQLRNDHQQKRFVFEVSQQHVANAKQDLQEGEKRKQQEEANLKKVEEDQKKSAEDLKQKQEAAAKANEAQSAVEQEQQAAAAKLKEGEKQLESAADDGAKQAANQIISESKQALEAATKKLEEAKKATKKATDELTASQRTLESADRSLERAKTALTDADQALEPLRKSVAQAEEQQQADEIQFKNAEKAENDFQLQASCLAMGKTHFAVGAVDGSVFVFQLQDGAAVEQFRVGESASRSIVFDGEQQLTTLDGSTVRKQWNLLPQWKLSKVIGSPVGESPFVDRITALAFSPDGAYVAVGGGEPSRSGELKIVAVSEGTITSEIEDAHSDTVFGLAFSPNGEQLASCGADRFMKVFDVRSGELLRTFEGHTHHVLDVAWQADGRTLATAGADKVVKVWDFQKGAQIRTIQGFGKEATALEFAGSTNRFFVSCGDRSLYRCDTAGARNGIGSAGDFLYSVSSNRLGDAVVFGGHDSIVRMANADGKEVIEHAGPNGEK